MGNARRDAQQRLPSPSRPLSHLGSTNCANALKPTDPPCSSNVATTATYREGAQKLLGVLITLGEAVAYVVSGMYGDVKDLGTCGSARASPPTGERHTDLSACG